MGNLPLVSIIVPIYNVEDYLERCIKSLLGQTLKNIEIILINDGSLDDSLKICLKYKSIDSRVIVINKENEGVSLSRNLGLKLSRGKYIGFVDPDDQVEIDMFQKLYEKSEGSNLDICLCDYMKIYNDGSTEKIIINRMDAFQDGAKSLIKHMIARSSFKSKQSPIMGSTCRALFKRNFLNQYQIRFNKELFMMEDLVFMIESLSKTNKVDVVSECLYYYFIRSNSAVHSYKENLLLNNLEVWRILKELGEAEGYDEDFFFRLDIRLIDIFKSEVANKSHQNNKISLYKNFKQLLKLSKSQSLRQAISNINKKERLSCYDKIILSSLINRKIILIYIGYKFKLRIQIFIKGKNDEESS